MSVRTYLMLIRQCVLVMILFVSVVSGIGVNWGSIMSHPINPQIAVQMLKDNGINQVKIFNVESEILNALKGTDMEVMIGVSNQMLKPLAQDYATAQEWVKANVTAHISDGVNIKYVAVGNEPFLTFYKDTNLNTTFPALQNVQKAINEAGHKDVKATVPHNADVYFSYDGLPSGGIFRPDISSLMVSMVKFLNRNKSPFLVNIYPFLAVKTDPHFPFNFAFYDNKSPPVVDGKLSYTNMFDANYDSLIWTLTKAGVPDLEIMVGEVGWPTDGDIYANVTLAKRFYDGFLENAKNGTPLRPRPFTFYLFGLFDEDEKSTLPGNFERHWGIFRYDGQPKFPIDLSGKSPNKLSVGAKGVEYLKEQWCVFNGNHTVNKTLLEADTDYACSRADCTSLSYGSSCYSLDDTEKSSYAFNQYFQTQNQNPQACYFDGNAHIVTKNASPGNCLFFIQINPNQTSLINATDPSNKPGHKSHGAKVAAVKASVAAWSFIFLVGLFM